MPHEQSGVVPAGNPTEKDRQNGRSSRRLCRSLIEPDQHHPLVATYSYVNPLVAILLGYSLGKEIITPRILLAAGLIIGSVVLVSAPR